MPIRRNYNTDFVEERAEGEGLPLLVGHAAVFNQIYETPWFTEEIMPGAFKASIERNDDVAALFNHDTNLPLARRRANNLSLLEDEKGLLSRFRPTATSYAKDLIENIRAGVVSQMSFGFQIEKEELDKSAKIPHYRITQVRLFDVSPVTFPAYEATDISLANAEEHIKQRLAQLDTQRSERDVAEWRFRQREIFLQSIRS